MRVKFKAFDYLVSNEKQLEVFSTMVKKKRELTFYPYRKFRISKINEYLYLYVVIQKKKKQKYVVVDIAQYDPYKKSLIGHFQNYKRHL